MESEVRQACSSWAEIGGFSVAPSARAHGRARRGAHCFVGSSAPILARPHEVQATFVPGPDGTPRLLDNGVWRLIGGTGALDGLKGAGTMHIKAVSPKDREFELNGEVVGLAR